MSKVTLILIGAGNISKRHISNLLEVEEAEIAAICDPSDAAVERIRSEFPSLKAPHYKDYRQALKEVQADAAVILTPHQLHYENAMDCLGAGLHLLIEKPFVHGVENGERVIQLAQEKGLQIAIAYQRHLLAPYMYMQELVKSGALGTVRYICAYQAQRWLESMKAESWRLNPALSGGGQLNDSGSHLLDAVLWATGLEPEQVSAQIDNRGTQVDIDSAVTVRFRGGAIGTFNVVGSATTAMYEDITINGDKGAVFYRNGELSVCLEGKRKPEPVSAEQLPVPGNPDRNFVELLLGKISEPAAPALCGVRINRLTEAAWESARLGGKVISL